VHSPGGGRRLMAAERNAERVRGGYDAFATADVPALVDLFAEDIVWHYPGQSSLAGDHVGRERVLWLLGQFAERTGDDYRAELQQVMANDDYAAGWARDVGRRKGKTLDVNAVVVFRLQGDRVAEAWHYFDDQRALDDFWS
jgi:ketosteroid isomerase-like protein